MDKLDVTPETSTNIHQIHGHGKLAKIPLFELRPGTPPNVLQEAICHRLEILSGMTDIMSLVESTSVDKHTLQCYAWAMGEIVSKLKVLGDTEIIETQPYEQRALTKDETVAERIREISTKLSEQEDAQLGAWVSSAGGLW